MTARRATFLVAVAVTVGCAIGAVILGLDGGSWEAFVAFGLVAGIVAWVNRAHE
jgi:hypothetical protein